MEPKEKAKELVDKYRKYANDGSINGYYSGETTFDNQKKCAIIAVNELIIETGSKYYYDVKSEIEKL